MVMIYLAGPIDDVKEDEAVNWRQEAANILKFFTCFNPKSAFINVAQDDFAALVEINRKALECADWVLVNLSGPGKAIGTIRELEQAVSMGKKVVVIMPDSVPRAGLSDVDHVNYSVSKACDYIIDRFNINNCALSSAVV